MVHAIRMLKCKKGHVLPISFDSNECGCHHSGKPCIIINCRECFKENFKKLKESKEVNEVVMPTQITIPLDEDGMKEINKLLNN